MRSSWIRIAATAVCASLLVGTLPPEMAHAVNNERRQAPHDTTFLKRIGRAFNDPATYGLPSLWQNTPPAKIADKLASPDENIAGQSIDASVGPTTKEGREQTARLSVLRKFRNRTGQAYGPLAALASAIVMPMSKEQERKFRERFDGAATSRDAAVVEPLKKDPFIAKVRPYLKKSARRAVGHVSYALRWGLILEGFEGGTHWVLKPLIKTTGWPFRIPQDWSEAFGRHEFLTNYTPDQINAALHAIPAKFMWGIVPVQVLMETGIYIVGWGLTTFYAIRGVAFCLRMFIHYSQNFRSQVLKSDSLDPMFVEDSKFWTMVGGGVKLISRTSNRVAFLFAALVSAGKFSFAHIAALGFHPELIVLDFVTGFALMRIWRRRSDGGMIMPVLAAALAHLTYLEINFALELPDTWLTPYLHSLTFIVRITGLMAMILGPLMYLRKISQLRGEAAGANHEK